MPTPTIGAHVSASGGMENAPKRAADIGCNAVQIFTSSPRTWQPADPEKINADGFNQACQEHGIIENVIHAIYLVNLASDKPELVAKSRAIIINDLKISALIGSVGVVVHLGSHQGRGYQMMRQQMIDEIQKILDETPDTSTLLIENSAGQKGKIASDLEEIQDLIQEVNSPRLGWCLDTCHAHAGGHKLTNSKFKIAKNKQITNSNTINSKQNTSVGSGLEPEPSTRSKLKVQSEKLEGSLGLFEPESPTRNIFTEIDRLNLWSSLKCVHVNDSRDKFGSGRDRHENLGEGLIPTDDLISFVNHPQIRPLPLILEVPGYTKKGPDQPNVECLVNWLMGVNDAR